MEKVDLAPGEEILSALAHRCWFTMANFAEVASNLKLSPVGTNVPMSYHCITIAKGDIMNKSF